MMSDALAGYIATGVIMLLAGLALRELEPKVKIVWWSSHGFLFELKDLTPPVMLFTHAITIQNIGRKPAEKIEIGHKDKPEFFKLQPALDYEESMTPAGEHVISVNSLGPKEFFTVEFLSFARISELLYIRSKVGHAQLIQIQPQRILSRWLRRLSLFVLVVGCGFLIYWLAKAVIFILRGIGIL